LKSGYQYPWFEILKSISVLAAFIDHLGSSYWQYQSCLNYIGLYWQHRYYTYINRYFKFCSLLSLQHSRYQHAAATIWISHKWEKRPCLYLTPTTYDLFYLFGVIAYKLFWIWHLLLVCNNLTLNPLVSICFPLCIQNKSKMFYIKLKIDLNISTITLISALNANI